MSDQLRLAKLLGQRSVNDLAKALVDSAATEKSFDNLLDFAGFLLQRKQLASRLASLHRSQLAALVSGESTPALVEHFVADEMSPLDSARELAIKLLENERQVVPQGEFEFSESRPLELVAQSIGQSTIALRELILSADRHWLKVMRQGLRKPDAVTFSEYIHFSPEDIQQLFGLATSLGLIRQEDDRWVASEAGLEWVSLTDLAAWSQIISELAQDLSQLSQVEPGTLLIEFLRTEYPLLEGSHNRIVRYGNYLGLAEQGKASALLVKILAGNIEACLLDLNKVWPTPTEKIIVQADQSITVPGPIPGWLHQEFSAFGDAVDVGLASRFRLSKLSICRALEIGLTANGIADRLGQLFGKELPQPVMYLIEDADRSLMNIKVSASGFGSVVDFVDRIDSVQMERDRTLSPLGLFRTNDYQLGSRLKRDIVWLAIRDAGYVAVRVDPEGQLITSKRDVPRVSEPQPDSSAEMASRLLQTSVLELDEQNLIKQLQFAQKNRLGVLMRVKLADSKELEFSAIVTGVSETRVRVRDAVADTERTLPLSSIVKWTLG